jgi:hypothetical protein
MRMLVFWLWQFWYAESGKAQYAKKNKPVEI